MQGHCRHGRAKRVLRVQAQTIGWLVSRRPQQRGGRGLKPEKRRLRHVALAFLPGRSGGARCEAVSRRPQQGWNVP